MSKLFGGVWCFFEAFGRARAASILVRQGRVQEAKALYQE